MEDDAIDIVYIATINAQAFTNHGMFTAWKAMFSVREKAIWGNYEELVTAYHYAKDHNLLLCVKL